MTSGVSGSLGLLNPKGVPAFVLVLQKLAQLIAQPAQPRAGVGDAGGARLLGSAMVHVRLVTQAAFADDIFRRRVAPGRGRIETRHFVGRVRTPSLRKVRHLKALARFDGSTGLPEKMPEVVGQPLALPENTPEDFEQAPALRENMSEDFGQAPTLRENTPEHFEQAPTLRENMSEVLGKISGLPEKTPGNSDHPPAFPPGAPENFAGISGRRFKGVEHQGSRLVGESRNRGHRE